MKKLEIVPDTKNISEAVGITKDRANELRAVIMVAVFAYFRSKLRPDGTAEIKDRDLSNMVLQAGLDEIDHSNLGEVFYLGFKYSELIEEVHRREVVDIYHTVFLMVGDKPLTIEEMVKIVAPKLDTK